MVLEQPWGSCLGTDSDGSEPRSGGCLRVLAGIYGGLPDSVTANVTVVRETFRLMKSAADRAGDRASWLAGGRKLRLGLAFSAQSFKNTNEVRPQLFSDGKLRGGLVAIFPSFRAQTMAPRRIRIRLSNLSLDDPQSGRYGSQLRLQPAISIRPLLGPWPGADKDRIVMGSSLSLYQEWRQEKLAVFLDARPERRHKGGAPGLRTTSILQRQLMPKAGWDCFLREGWSLGGAGA